MPVLTRVRRDVSAVKGEVGSYWTKEPINRDAIIHHLNGGPARGACPIKEGESVTMLAVFDLDSHKGETDFSQMAAVGDALMDELYRYGLHGVPFASSGGRGIHVLLLWEQPQDAYSVRLRLREVLANLGYSDGAKGVAQKQIEIFPKQDEVGVGEYGNQFILPLAGLSVPLDKDTLAKLDKAAVLDVEWLMSEAVPHVLRPVREAGVSMAGTEPIERVIEALAAIPNNDDVDYFKWRDMVFAVHEATGGSEEGFDAVCEWSAQSPLHDEKFMRSRVWSHVKSADSRSDGGITRATLYREATANGWTRKASADGFEEVDVEVGPARPLVLPSAQLVEVIEASTPPSNISAKSTVANAVANAVGEVTTAFIRDNKGQIEAVVPNLMKVMRRPDLLMMDIGFDNWDEQIKWRVPGEVDGWRLFTDEHYMDIREHLETPGSALNNSFKQISREMVRDCVFKRARENQFDSGIHWIKAAKWDGVPRVERFFLDYFGLDDTPYHRAAALYLWTALAGRMLVPGVKADMVIVLVGDQGLRKSTAIESLAPHEDMFTEISFHEKEDDLSRKLRGKAVAEIGELRGLGTKDQDGIKAFITRRRESWVPKFKEFETRFQRRCVFIASTNEGQFLADTTGNRRWVPLYCMSQIDTEGIAAIRDQLWAEGAVLYQQTGVQWQKAQELAVAEHERYEHTDSWVGLVRDYIAREDMPESEPENGVPESADTVTEGVPARTVSKGDFVITSVTTRELLVGALRFEPKQIAKKDEMHMASVLKKLGFQRVQKRIGDDRVFVWEKSVPTVRTLPF